MDKKIIKTGRLPETPGPGRSIGFWWATEMEGIPVCFGGLPLYFKPNMFDTFLSFEDTEDG